MEFHWGSGRRVSARDRDITSGIFSACNPPPRHDVPGNCRPQQNVKPHVNKRLAAMADNVSQGRRATNQSWLARPVSYEVITHDAMGNGIQLGQLTVPQVVNPTPVQRRNVTIRLDTDRLLIMRTESTISDYCDVVASSLMTNWVAAETYPADAMSPAGAST